MTDAAFALAIVVVAFAGSICYELMERSRQFWTRAIYRTLAWGWIGLAGALLAALLRPVG